MDLESAGKAYAEGAVFVAFDVETTGLNPRRDRIVEIGAVKFDKNGLIATFSALINPGIPMPAGAKKVNNISNKMLRGKPAIETVLPDFLLFIEGAVLAAHNAPFDLGFINGQLRLCQKTAGAGFWPGGKAFDSLPNPVADTLAFSRALFAGLKSRSLQNLAADLGIPALDAHRAEDDARLCMEILLRCLARDADSGL